MTASDESDAGHAETPRLSTSVTLVFDTLCDLTLSVLDRFDDGVPSVACLRFRNGDLDARLRFDLGNGYTPGVELLVEWFTWMEQHWRGWEGEHRWESVEHDVSLGAIHRGHLRIGIELRPVSEPWTMSSQFQIEQGEQLRRLSEQVRQFASPPRAAEGDQSSAQ